MRYRVFTEDDFEALSTLDLTVQRHLEPGFDALPEREQEGRLRTSLPSLRFYLRSEHSFVAEEDGQLRGLMLAQSVWMGDRPIILVTACLLHPDLGEQTDETGAALLHAVIKSAYDAAVYEIHYAVTSQLQQAAEAEGSHVLGRYAVHHLGSRQQTAPGERFTGGGYTDAGRIS
ncbi:DUF1999 domain-containing protein [Deinococcus sp. KNUC1210]|uniref:DUF1999 domain-containing protein n=1 Tax=Deinococcus sp. KNUC1210 TaxID=2917691 RepID=UPI001EF07221|nr:DUF1999 domain-containing protein [Deinococcus sp. KNUC1210]ULH15250.1 DUF1999 domain-containing protein [Deinococcus sp. KNUC1210]